MKNKKVAVIMSVYRNDKLPQLILAVDSILGQTFQSIQLFIYRDGVLPFELNNYLEDLSKNKNVTYVRGNINSGLAFALNSLIDIVVADSSYFYIARMDSDDISRKDRILKQVNFLEQNLDIDVCGSSCREFGSDFAINEKKLPQYHDELLSFSITRCPFIHPTVVFRSKVFSSGIRYPLNMKFTEDMALWFILLHSKHKFANLNDILLDYRMNDNTCNRRKGISKAISEIFLRTKYMFLLKKFSFLNCFLILSRFAFHLMPSCFVKYAYKNLR